MNVTQPREVRFGQGVVECQGAQRHLLRVSHSLRDRRGAVVELQRVRIGEPGIGERVARILGDGTVEVVDRGRHVGLSAFVPGMPAA
jgi:hypothetical protein